VDAVIQGLLTLQVGVSTLGYPSGLADPLDRTTASAVEGQITADSATATSAASSNDEVASRQPPTAAEVTAAAFPSPTFYCDTA